MATRKLPPGAFLQLGCDLAEFIGKAVIEDAGDDGRRSQRVHQAVEPDFIPETKVDVTG